ncbi:hypothetical protein FHS85_004810 [Rhodoligotrophos appendicifer]|uniref:hypothetical protein n=1 Tax=Rhodoligotrophos appendicifer TaxID=987056 RepID=UPI0014789D3B|nr:hypothetical protein [Rhodoligotrophos appendicifer]
MTDGMVYFDAQERLKAELRATAEKMLSTTTEVALFAEKIVKIQEAIEALERAANN